MELVMQPLSKTTYVNPRRCASIAVARPVGPAPMIAISSASIFLIVIAALGDNHGRRGQFQAPVFRPLHNQFSCFRVHRDAATGFSIEDGGYRRPARSRPGGVT